MTNLKPYGERVIVKRLQKEEKTKSGIILSDSTKDKTDKAIVLATNDDSLFSVNDTVLLAKNAGNPVKDGEDDLLVVKVCDVIAVIEND